MNWHNLKKRSENVKLNILSAQQCPKHSKYNEAIKALNAIWGFVAYQISLDGRHTTNFWKAKKKGKSSTSNLQQSGQVGSADSEDEAENRTVNFQVE